VAWRTAADDARLEGERADHDWPAVRLRAAGFPGLAGYVGDVRFIPADRRPGGLEYTDRDCNGCDSNAAVFFARCHSPTRRAPTGVADVPPPAVTRLRAALLRVLELACDALGVRPVCVPRVVQYPPCPHEAPPLPVYRDRLYVDDRADPATIATAPADNATLAPTLIALWPCGLFAHARAWPARVLTRDVVAVPTLNAAPCAVENRP
jgi:hypothetical protein